MKKSQILDDFKLLIRIAEGAIEILFLTAIFEAIWRVAYYGKAFPSSYAGRELMLLIVVYVILTVTVFALCDCFHYGYVKLGDLLVSQWVSAFIVNFLAYFILCLAAHVALNPGPMFLIFLMDAVVTAFCGLVYTAIYHRVYVPKNMLLIYENESALDLKFKMDERNDKYAITEIISAHLSRNEICKAISRHDAVVINDIAGTKRNDILKYCYENSVRTYVVPKVSDIILTSAQNITLFDTPLKLVKGRGLSLIQCFVKRTFDMILCLVAMIPAVPLMFIIAAAIKIQDGGPVFYKQKRVTKDGKTFDILKFRSMVVDAESGGYDLSMRANGKDPRITKVGSVIRATRVDELPQLLNIIKGDMTIVGPRPERVENVEAYSAEMPEWHFREKVKAGLTGYAQIYGKYNTSAYDKLRLDLLYIENYSLLLDIRLIFQTVRILFSKEATEGFDKAEELEAKRERLVKELTKETGGVSAGNSSGSYSVTTKKAERLSAMGE